MRKVTFCVLNVHKHSPPKIDETDFNADINSRSARSRKSDSMIRNWSRKSFETTNTSRVVCRAEAVVSHRPRPQCVAFADDPRMWVAFSPLRDSSNDTSDSYRSHVEDSRSSRVCRVLDATVTVLFELERQLSMPLTLCLIIRRIRLEILFHSILLTPPPAPSNLFVITLRKIRFHRLNCLEF